MPTKKPERINFGKIQEIISPPNLIEVQLDSYKDFLQADTAASKRRNLGLQAVFTEVFPIESYDGKCVLDFHFYDIGAPKLDWLECLREGLTFGAPLYVTFRLKDARRIIKVLNHEPTHRALHRQRPSSPYKAGDNQLIERTKCHA